MNMTGTRRIVAGKLCCELSDAVVVCGDHSAEKRLVLQNASIK